MKNIKNSVGKISALYILWIALLTIIGTVLSVYHLSQAVKASTPEVEVVATVSDGDDGEKKINLKIVLTDDSDTEEELKSSTAWRWTILNDDNDDNNDNSAGCDLTTFAEDSGNDIQEKTTTDSSPDVSWGADWEPDNRRYICFEITDSDDEKGYGASNTISYDDLFAGISAKEDTKKATEAKTTENTGKIDDLSDADEAWATILIVVGIIASATLPITLYNIYKRGNHLR